MVKAIDTSIYTMSVGSKFFIIKSALFKDSSFPFTEDDRLIMKVVGSKVIVEKDKNGEKE